MRLCVPNVPLSAQRLANKHSPPTLTVAEGKLSLSFEGRRYCSRGVGGHVSATTKTLAAKI